MGKRKGLSAAAAILFALATSRSASAGLSPGQKLDQSTWHEAQGLFPPEILDHYKKGEFSSPIGEMKVPYALDESVLEAAEKNEGKYKIDERGTLVEASTGKIPEYLFGPPFGKLDPKDPQIAQKIVWNYEYAYWSNGSNNLDVLLTWVTGSSNSQERQVVTQTITKVIEGNRHREPNPQQFSRLDRNFLIEPTDIHGTASLGWRYKDPEKRDNVWAYVPALRRVRAVSPANRSDGVFGSEMTQDDGFNGFDGKPEDFTYELVGTTD